MPTNLKSLLTRSRSKNELKLRESKDEISPAGNSESSNGESGGDDSVCCANGNGRCSEQQVKDDECCRGCCRQRSESPLDLGSNATTKAVLRSYSSENNCFPSNDISYNSDSYSKSDESPPALSSSSSCSYSDENFIKSLNCTAGPATGCGGTLSTMLPPGNSFHHQQQHPQGPYQCCSQHKSYSNGGGGGGLPYEMIPGIGGAPAVSGDVSSPLDLSGYFLDEKSNSIMDRRDNGEGEMRLNSNRTLFLSCNTLHQPSCATSFESSGHMDTPPPPLPISTEFPATHVSSSLISGGSGAAVSASLHHHQQQHQIGPNFRTRTGAVDGCGSMACELPSAAPSCCTYNSKEGFPPANSQGLTMRKCETVLALSSLNNGTISTTTSPLTATTSNGNKSSSSYARNSGGLTNFAKFPGGAVPVSSLTSSGSTTMSHLSASSGGGASSSGSNVGGKVRVMKEKILSTSSSALNCLLHSSSRTGKLLSGWKLSSGASSSSNGGSSLNVGHMFGGSSEGSNCLGGNCQSSKHFLGVSSSSSATAANESNKLGSAATSHQHHHHKSRSQLSISENSFSSSPAPLTPVNRLRRNVSVNNTNSFCPTSGGSLSAHSSYSRSSSVSSFAGWKEKDDPFEQNLFCRLCLSYVRLEETMEIVVCKCRYCKDCLISYVSFEITEGADEIACPDASCEKQGVLGMQEVEQLVSPVLIEKHKKFKLFREVEKDNKLMWCPSPGCETVCQIQTGNGILTGGYIPEIDRAHGGPVVVAPSGGGSRSLPFIQCHTCHKTHCANCKLSWHPDSSCESFRRKLIKQGKLTVEDDELFSLDSIKKCPFCHVPIEKDSGCAQMMCKRCKHVFCWYCLASLDDDFLLRHYDKGPCKNKLGHSRASVVWHRAQVIGIFAGFGVLVLLASPLLILAAPCLLCCRCRYCANKLDPEESDLV